MARVSVFCSSSKEVSPWFLNEAQEFGAELARYGHTLVYGGTNQGMMGALAQGALASGGKVIGIIPEVDFLMRNVQEGGCEMVKVKNLSQRKELMIEKADFFVALPGGVGTLDEIFEVLARKQMGECNDKQFWFYNPFNYWNPLLESLEIMGEQTMITVPMGDLIKITDRREEIFTAVQKSLLEREGFELVF
ncbi:MAG: TIGR00730 family Rossman fold protein [Bdellovibrionales bacterium]|nr:TIGR00730 family Rossman fold protein [Bdellovibrionales bacterium]